MHFLVITMNYTPEPTGVSPFNTGLCEHLIARGHRVSVITTFPHYPQWRIYDEYRGALYKCEVINGVDVRRVIHFVPSRPRNLIQRLFYGISFSLNALLLLGTVGHYDGVFCASPPPFVPPVAWLAGRLKGVPTIVKLTDMALDVARSLGIVKDKTILTRFAQLLEDFNYRRMTAISVLCPAFKNSLMGKGIPGEKIYLVPVWADTELVHPLPRNNEFRKKQGLSDKQFIAIYSGNMGLKQGLSTMVEAANLTQAMSDIIWFLVGTGEDRNVLEDLAAKYALENLRFLPLQPLTIFPSMLAAADALLLIQKSSVIDTVIPSKLLTYMAAGRPVIASVHLDSTAAYYIREANCGVVVEPENPSALIEAIVEFRNNPAYAGQLGTNGRAYVEQHFSKSVVLAKYDRLFWNVFPDFS